MAAKNPFRVSDLIKKYGWTIMPYLGNLDPTLLAEAQILFVDSGHTNALDADDTEHGHEITKPLATWDYATGLCTASEQCIIFLAPGHNENLANAQIDLDVIGVHTIGIGSGSLKPRIDFEHANSSVNIGANNVTIQNVDLLPAVELILIGVHVETDVTDFRMKDVRFLIGEDGGGVDEFVKAVEMTSGNDDCVFEDVSILCHASAGGATHGIHVAAAADRTVWRNVVIDGPYATGGIVEAAAGVNHVVEDCAIDTTGTNYSFNGSSTFAKRTRNLDGGAETGIGTEFWIKKTLVSSAIVTGGVDVSGISVAGELAIVDVICKTDSTGLAAGTNLELLTDNTNGLVNFYVEAVSNLGGQKTIDLAGASVTKIKTVVEVGKKLIAKSTGIDCTGGGEIDVYIKFQRLTAGAIISAA